MDGDMNQHADPDAPINRCGPMIRVRCFRDGEALVRNVADLLEETILSTADADPTGLLLAGGSTPYPAYAELADRDPPSKHLTLMFTDERYVSRDDEASNYHQSRGLILGLDLPEDRVLRVETDRPLVEAAQGYETALRGFVEGGGRIPLGILGLGADGHTASLFTPQHLEKAEGRFAIAVKNRPDGRSAVSVTPSLLARVDRLVFLVAGAAKREVLARMMKEPSAVIAGQAVAGHANVEVWCDPEAWPR